MSTFTIIWFLFLVLGVALLHIDMQLFRKQLRRLDDMHPLDALAWMKSRDGDIWVKPYGSLYLAVRDWWRERQKGFRA